MGFQAAVHQTIGTAGLITRFLNAQEQHYTSKRIGEFQSQAKEVAEAAAPGETIPEVEKLNKLANDDGRGGIIGARRRSAEAETLFKSINAQLGDQARMSSAKQAVDHQGVKDKFHEYLKHVELYSRGEKGRFTRFDVESALKEVKDGK